MSAPGDRARQPKGHIPAIIWLSLFGLLAVVMLFSFLVVRDREDVVEATSRRAQEQALVLADHAARLFEAAELALSTTIDDTQHLDWSDIRQSPVLWDRMRRLATRLPYLDGFWLNDAVGALMLTSHTFPAPQLDDSDRDYFVVHRENPYAGVHVSPRVEAPGEGATFRLSRRLEHPNGSFRGVASLTIEAGYFHRLYGSLPLPMGTAVILLRMPDLVPLVQEQVGGGSSTIGLHDASHLRESLAHAPGGGKFRAVSPVDGRDRVYAYKHVPGFPLLVKVSVPLDSLRGEWLELVRSRMVMAALALGAWGMLTVFGMRQEMRQREFQRQLTTRVAERTAELAQANRQMETLIHEVHHRVNNNLQIISSLLMMQSAQAESPQVKTALAHSTGRVHTLGLAYQTLYGTGAMVELPFGHYLSALARHTGDLYSHGQVEVKVEGTDPRFHIDTAVPLALVVHEVLSNALTHAFRAGRQGTIRIALTDEPERWSLTIADDGVGLPEGFDWTTSDGLGLAIVRSLVQQLNGHASLVNQNGGTCFRLHWPKH